MKKAEEFFEKKNNGKLIDKMFMDGDYISPLWTVELMEEYANHYHQQQMEEVMPEWNSINQYPEGIEPDDDFIAKINGYILRVEQNGTFWWYSVGKGVLELCHETNAGSEEKAKQFAEGVYLQHYIKSLLKDNDYPEKLRDILDQPRETGACKWCGRIGEILHEGLCYKCAQYETI